MKILLELNHGKYLIVEESFASILADVIANSRVAIIENSADFQTQTYVETDDVRHAPTLICVPEKVVTYLPETEGDATE